ELRTAPAAYGCLVRNGLGAVLDRRVRPVAGADIHRGRPDHLVVRVLLPDVRGPTGHARSGEDRRQQVRGDPEHVVHARGVEVDVRVQTFLRHHRLLDGLGDLVPTEVTVALAPLLRQLLEHPGPRVHRRVHRVTEPHDLLVTVEAIADVRLSAV